MALAYLRHNICVIVLAGGQSSRMGQDKALLEIKGIPLLQKVGEVALACSDRVYIVTGSPHRYQHLPIATHCQFLKETNAQGPLISFRDSLSHLVNLGSPKPFWVMLLACDLPNLQDNVLQDWITQLTYLPDTVMAYLPKHAAIASTNHSNKQWEPLCGLYRSDCLVALQKFILSSDGGGKSFQTWLTHIQVAEIPCTDPQMLFNCNTLTDFDMVVQASADK